MSTQKVTSVDELCAAVETTLRAKLADAVAALGYTDLDDIQEWQQLPTVDALTSAELPAIAVSSPGLSQPPSLSRASGVYRTTWRIVVGVFDRGEDHRETQAHVRNFCAAIRTTLLANKSLGGIADALEWAAELYDLLPGRAEARTIGAGTVEFDVTVDVPAAALAGLLPTIEATPTSVSVR